MRVLQKNGLNEKQAAVYLALLALGQGTVAQIATAAALKRPLVYLLLEELKQRGHITELIGHTVKRYTTVDPRLFLKQQKSALVDLEFMMPSLTRQHERGVTHRPWVEVIESAAGIVRLYRQFGRVKDARYISSYAHLRATFPEEVQQWIQSAKIGKSEAPRYQIIVDEPEGRAFAEEVRSCPAWHIRLLPARTKIEANFDIMEDVVMITHFDPLFATVVHSDSLATDYAALFELLWKGCVPYKKRNHPPKGR